MDNKKYSITLADGTIIDDLTLNGNNFVSKTKIDAEVFEYNCSPVIINNGSTDEIHPNMELVQVTKQGDEFWFILRDISKVEMSQIKMQSDLEYVAMMTGVEL